MFGIDLSSQLRTVLGTARREASRFHHEYIGGEHMLLGLLHEKDGGSASVLRQLGIDPERIRQKLEETMRPGPAGMARPDLPYTSRAKRVIELTLEEAARSKAAFADTEHLLVALCVEGKGIAAEVLKLAGLTPDVARAAVDQLNDARGGSPPPPA